LTLVFTRTLADFEGNSPAPLLTKQDGPGFCLTIATAHAGESWDLCFQNHWEVMLVLEGHGRFEDPATGEITALVPGTVSCMGPGQKHRLTIEHDMKVMGLFNPALKGALAVPTSFVRSFERPDTAGNISLLSTGDGIGCSASEVRSPKNTCLTEQRQDTWKIGYIVSGRGELTDQTSRDATLLGPDMLYCLEPGDDHHLLAHSDLHLIKIDTAA
jgi:quercetin dioxygenase-like cupin family protein